MPDQLANAPVTRNHVKMGLAAGTTTTISTTVTGHYAINSVLYTKTAITNGATPTTDAVTGAAFVPIPYPSYGCKFVWGLDSSGNQKVAQGTIQALDAAGAYIVAPQFPSIPDTMCPCGIIDVKLGASAVATWTFGTNNLSSVTGVTYTFSDIATLPGRPQA